ncbi:MAG TPA: CAP domain-containing protein [Syntrophorhabdaceae bacterium]|nr:CAP domain-containing protein [Syntrophorhabdaceae bacterium]
MFMPPPFKEDRRFFLCEGLRVASKPHEREPAVKRIIFFFALAVFALGPVSFHVSLHGRILGFAESWATTDRIVMVREGAQDPRGPSEAKAQAVGSRLTVQEVRQLLTAHNKARAEANTAPVSWSDRLASYAQEWADHLASSGRRMEHRPHAGKWKQEYGENLFMGTAGYYGPVDAVAAWEREKSAYHGEPIDMSSLQAYGHYTQLVWKNTTRIGCAKVLCDGSVIVVCNYDPPGNVLGQLPY